MNNKHLNRVIKNEIKKNIKSNERVVKGIKREFDDEKRDFKVKQEYYDEKREFKDIKREFKDEKYNKEVYELEDSKLIEKEKPNFEPSGLLAIETNNRNGIQLKYVVPEESIKPDLSWRLYIFKSNDKEPPKVIKIDEKEYYLIGKDHRIVDINLFHPSISKQHAVIQYRHIEDQILPYLIDLNSTNGTYINDMKLESSKYYELRYFLLIIS
ncbi:uncharacterized protein TA15135 [Theileria annulata]|uniref:FHA domain-containing protein n=1 Tax=Theileria annulata TaxID=5874 RepID=Q4UFC2_THEAN|nr:uncharacterized protein TA15135 [Theileria annulata]CAI74194.1 hypothetical protein, conserved [Theileria annulata]|eukprot:XP_951926.1 hypothetical protein, conserved [Theileria annulata]